MKYNYIAFVLALVITTVIFSGLAELHVKRIQIQEIKNKPTQFYKVFKPKIKKQIKKKKKLKAPKKKKKPVKKKEKKLEKKRSKKVVDKVPDQTEEVVDITEIDQVAVVRQKVTPKYPELARKAGVECKVLVEVIIDTQGNVAEARVIYVSKKGHGFERNALRAVKKLKFEPIKQNGIAINVKIIYPIEFVLIK